MAIAILLGVLLFVVSMGFQGWLSHRRPELGLSGDKLRPCPESPNCVSSDATDEQHRVDTRASESRERTFRECMLKYSV